MKEREREREREIIIIINNISTINKQPTKISLYIFFDNFLVINF